MIAGNRAVRFGSFGVRFCSVGMPAAVWFSLVASLQAAPPPLREQVSLNGQWLYAPRGAAPTTRNVPGENGDLQEAANDSGSHFKGFGFDGTDSAWYERIAVVPAAWAGKRIMFESDYVGHVVEVYVGDRLAGTHVGMALPFRIDVTELVTPGAEVRIRVRVWDRSKEPVHVGENSSGAPRYFWPNASWDNGCQWYGDVWLRAYGQVHLAETFIQTSWRQGKIAVDYEIANTTGNDRTVRIEAVAKRTVAELSFAGEPTLVKAGHKAKMRVEKPWKNAALWNAETPNLYQLESAVRDVADQSVLDCESRRFGFREFWIDKNQYVLNGVRLNLRGDAGSGVQPRASRDDFALLIDTLKEHNLNVIKPVWDTYPIWILDLADEKGIYVMQEVAFGASGDGTYADFDQVQTNVEKYNHIGIRAWRNHPSVVIWSLSLELWGWFHKFQSGQFQELGKKAMDLDSTRPVTFSGEQDSRLGAVDWHYPVSTVGTGTPPDGYNESFYPFALMVHPERPFAATEDVGAWAVGVPCAWWQGFFLRGMRCNDWADIRPIGLSIWLMSPKKPYMGKVEPEWGTKAANLKASAAPVGLYDKEYDDIPTAVKALRDRVYPEIKEGEIQKRLLELFNDEMSGAEVAATVEAFLDGEPTPFAQRTRTYRLTPGDHLTIPCRFQAPYVEANRTMKLVLRTSKGGVARFSEDRLFTVKDAGRSGTPSDKVELRAPVAPILLYDFDEGLSPKFSRMAAASAVTAVGGALGPPLYPSCVANKGTLAFSPGSGRSFAWSFNATGMSNLLVRFYLAAYGGDAKAEAPKIVGMDVGQDPTKVAPEPAKPYVLPSVQVTVDGVAHEVTGAWAGGTWRGAGQRYGLHATKCVELDLSDLADGRRSVRVSMSLPEIPAQGHIYLEDLQVLGTCAGVAGAVPPPASVAARAVGPLAIDVEWKPPVSTAKLTCNVYRDGRRLNNLQVEGASFRDFGLQPTTQYKYTVTAEDPAGNESAAVSTTATTGPMWSEIAVNFQPASMPPVTGCEVDSGAPYDERRPGLRHGWLRPERRAACSPVERNVNPDKLLDSCVGMDKGLEWEIDVANGVYEVTASVGDAGADTTNWLNVEGQPFLAGVALKRDKFAQTTRRLLVRDGKLTLDNDCQATMTALNYLRVRYVSPPVAPPVADAGPDRNVPAAAGEAAAVKLDASGSQVAGKIVDCVWTGVGRNVLSKSKTDTIRVQRRGIQTIRLTVTDDLGLTACDCFNLNVFDSDSPAAPQGLKATALAPTEIKVEWSPSASAPAIETKYVLYRDNKLIATVCGTGYRDGGLQPGTAYSYTVKAVDAAERTSPASEPRRATTPTGQDPGLLAYEGFTQPAGILHGGNQGFGWAGPWSIECSQYSFLRIATMQVRPVLDEPILSGPAASLARTGSHVWCWQPASGYRPLDVDGAFADYRVSSTDRNLGKSGTVLWFSCLARMDAPEPTASLKPCNLGFRRRAGDKWEGTDAFSIGGFGFDKEKKATWKIEAGPPGQPLSKTDTGIPCMLNRVHLVVVRMTFGTPSRIDLYIDPPVGGVPPDKPDATAQVPNADGSFKFAWFTFRSAVDPGWPAARYGHRLDELRLGRSFAAVTPEDAKRGTP